MYLYFIISKQYVYFFNMLLRFLQIFKVAQKLGQSPCTIVQGLEPNFTKNEKERILHFYNFF